MAISFELPEGEPDRCPICRRHVQIESPLLFGDIPCPHCGHLLWFINESPEARIFDFERAKTVRNRLIDLISQRLGIDREEVTGDLRHLADLASDELDLVELVMDLEEGCLWRQ